MKFGNHGNPNDTQVDILGNFSGMFFRTSIGTTDVNGTAMFIDRVNRSVTIGSTYAGTPIAAPADGLIVQGNVGIGTTAPQGRLHIRSPQHSDSNPKTYSTYTTDQGVLIDGYEVNSAGGFVRYTDIVALGHPGVVGSNIRFLTEGGSGSSIGERMRITNSGNVGIGTTGPGYKLDVAGDIRATSDLIAQNVKHYYLTRVLPTTVNDYVEIGKFTVGNSGHSLDITVTVTDGAFSVAKRYILPLNYNINSDWQIALPISDTGAYSGNNFDLDVKQVNGEQTVYLRLRRTAGTTAGTAIVQIQQRGSVNDAFTAMTGAGTATAPTSFLSTTALTQVGGNVGIGTTTPFTKLHLYDSSSGPIITLSGSNSNYRGLTIKDTAGSEQWFYGPNNSNNFVVRRSGSSDYITVSSSTGKVTLSGGMKIQSGATLDMTDSSNAINMAGGNIYQVGKLTAASIDPLYNIEGKNYSTYVSSIAGPIKEEYVGKGRAALLKDNFYEFVLDFNSVEYGSALWVWRKVVDFNKENVDVFITPIGKPDLVSYEVKENSIIFRSKSPAEFSYRLVGNRFDWGSWPVLSKDQSEKPSFVIH